MINLDGRGPNTSERCPCCAPEGLDRYPEFECLDCWGRYLRCKECMVATHTAHPLHRIRRWNGEYFERSSLKSLGVRIQLGHLPGQPCANPQICFNDDFIIIDGRGIHSVGLDYCGCGTLSQTRFVQLLRYRLYPATTTNPKTAATFRCLESYELLSYESKVSSFEYYHALVRLTDNTGTHPPKNRYPKFLLMIRQWRYLKMLKRSARGHDPIKPATATNQGECALLCPACPQPGKNLPSDWKELPENKKFVFLLVYSWHHALFIGIDANFRLKRKNVSSDRVDPDLGKGFAYFVEESEYKEYLTRHQDEVEPKSTCSRHDAVNLSNSKPGQGHAATGVGTIECARHNMKRPMAVGDLQRGERYCNIDYLFWKSLINSVLERIYISYDIVCQWSINLQKRMAALDHTFVIFNGKVFIKFLVPKFHLPAHISKCRSSFSFNYTVGVGRTDGEAPERGWAEINPLAMSTKEMGPGSRRDILDAHFGDYNWRKIIGMGSTLIRKFTVATSDMVAHVLAHRGLELSLPRDTVTEWTAAVVAWEMDPSKPNPFEVQVDLPTQAAVWRELAEAEALDLATGKDFTLDANVSPSVFISSGLDLEAEQRAVKTETNKMWLHSQDRQKTKLQLRYNALSRKIVAWSRFQQLYIPTTVILRREDTEADLRRKAPLPTYAYPLWLPSHIKTKVSFDLRLAEIEYKLRVAQARESLESLRRNLQMRSYLRKFKNRFSRGQGANTRARNALDGVNERIMNNANEYRAAFDAIVSLTTLLGKVGWEQEFKVLADGDIREVSEADDGQSEGKRLVSWVWKTVQYSEMGNDDTFRDTLRIEWCKLRARAMRFVEEVELLSVEMMRVLQFFQWQAGWWRSIGSTWNHATVKSDMRREGLIGYAKRQAAMRDSLSAHFVWLWSMVPRIMAKVQGDIAEGQADIMAKAQAETTPLRNIVEDAGSLSGNML
ncbi:hypothetical protein BDZ94DRAFT_1221539 [Collybia nuda]|uniref:CxC2-like cysteine cluster KDZ transposase-associated domain-containing protein n=1 Tax=Collybia nuda TaxID=64659 RepID=A0A9P6CHZ1_9AGAR|nr:hypothetical protein BDZ94DRAFT_1221539 [Collybia nuda]